MRTVGGYQHQYGHVRRVFYGDLWSLYTVLLAVIAVSSLSKGTPQTALLCVVPGFLTGMYAYRIWFPVGVLDTIVSYRYQACCTRISARA